MKSGPWPWREPQLAPTPTGPNSPPVSTPGFPKLFCPPQKPLLFTTFSQRFPWIPQTFLISQNSDKRTALIWDRNPGSGTTTPRLLGGSPLSESRNAFADGSIRSRWSRLSKHFGILTNGSRRTAAGWSCLNPGPGPGPGPGPYKKKVGSPVYWYRGRQALARPGGIQEKSGQSCLWYRGRLPPGQRWQQRWQQRKTSISCVVSGSF